MGRKQTKLAIVYGRPFLSRRSGGKLVIVPFREVSGREPKNGEYAIVNGKLRLSKRDFLRPRVKHRSTIKNKP